MLQIKNRGKQLLEARYGSTKSMIFPFILKGSNNLPPQIRRIPYYDISKILLIYPSIPRKILRDKLDSIVKVILEHYFNLKKLYYEKTNYEDYECNKNLHFPQLRI